MNEFEKQMMGRATEIMKARPDLEEKSKIREQNKFQEEDVFWSGKKFLSEDDIDRRPCTYKEKNNLNKSIEQLGDLFVDADFYWQLDGALNISLYRGEYIGIHKDIDLSLDIKDIEKVEDFLGKKGFGLFLSSGVGGDKKAKYERIDGSRINNNIQGFHPMIFKIDLNGKIMQGDDAYGIDTHIIKWNESDEPISGKDSLIPREWLKPLVIEFNGRKINCSHPALAAFHKLFFTRKYDDNDLKLLAQTGKLNHDDIMIIEKVFNDSIKDRKKEVIEYTNRVFLKINFQKEKQEIFETLINDELVINMKDDKGVQDFFDVIAEKIASLNEITIEKVYDIIFAATPIDKLVSQRDSKIAILRNNIPDNK